MNYTAFSVGVARRRHRALRCGDRTYLNLVSSYLCHYTCAQFLALFTKSSDRIPDTNLL
ncbi:MAG: hypothetical protein RMX96_04170 [Nostoc sp. ChiSLP02]|nr:hypothetical protein [Nostoc sp. DedSLP05]MDZ8098142.1 hypothetical protein [Nostoc sp. DedSLP01]MDZ8184043.1 hypothetical protein [Nostoc sp. ChiSLP02]